MNWVILLTRGRVAVHVLRSDWQLNGRGMAEVIDSMSGWLQELLGPGARLPRVVFTDRGTGMYSPGGAHCPPIRSCPQARRMALLLWHRCDHAGARYG